MVIRTAKNRFSNACALGVLMVYLVVFFATNQIINLLLDFWWVVSLYILFLFLYISTRLAGSSKYVKRIQRLYTTSNKRYIYSIILDINECDPDKPLHRCAQICENIPGGYTCSCQIGFQLTKDRFDCEGESLTAVFNLTSPFFFLLHANLYMGMEVVDVTRE